MTAAPNQNLKTSKHLDNSVPSCKSKFQTLQKLCNYLITVAKSQKIQNPLPGCGPSCKSKQQLRNSRIILSPSANQKLTTKPENCSISLTESENSRHVKTAGLPWAMTPHTKKTENPRHLWMHLNGQELRKLDKTIQT